MNYQNTLRNIYVTIGAIMNKKLRLTLIVNEKEYTDLIEFANDKGVPLKTLMMRTMNQLVWDHKAHKENWNAIHNS